MCFVYIIKSSRTQKWQVGWGADLIGCIARHNGIDRYSKKKGEWSFIFVRPFDSEPEARRFEKYLQKNLDKPEVLKKFEMYFRYQVYPGEKPT